MILKWENFEKEITPLAIMSLKHFVILALALGAVSCETGSNSSFTEKFPDPVIGRKLTYFSESTFRETTFRVTSKNQLCPKHQVQIDLKPVIDLIEGLAGAPRGEGLCSKQFIARPARPIEQTCRKGFIYAPNKNKCFKQCGRGMDGLGPMVGVFFSLFHFNFILFVKSVLGSWLQTHQPSSHQGIRSILYWRWIELASQGSLDADEWRTTEPLPWRWRNSQWILLQEMR